MARRRDFARGAAAIKSRRSTVWFSFPPQNATLAAAGGTLVASLNAGALALRPFTVIRTRLVVFASSDQSVASERFGWGLGMAVVSDQASAIGVTAVPTPITDLDSDLFFVHKLGIGEFELSTAVGEMKYAGDGAQYEIDSKAMRKVNPDEDVILSMESMVATVGEGSLVSVAGRMLVKLH